MLERKELQLPKQLINSANSLSHYNAGSIIAREANSQYERFFQEFAISMEHTPQQIEYLQCRAEQWYSLITSCYTENLRRRASWVPVTIAGPSKYDSTKENKKADKALRVAIENNEKINRFISNTKKHLIQIPQTATEQTEENKIETINGVELLHNTQIDRLQIYFDDKPPAPIIQALKSRGFRWSPRNAAWQRQLTTNAITAAKTILKGYEVK